MKTITKNKTKTSKSVKKVKTNISKKKSKHKSNAQYIMKMMGWTE